MVEDAPTPEDEPPPPPPPDPNRAARSASSSLDDFPDDPEVPRMRFEPAAAFERGATLATSLSGTIYGASGVSRHSGSANKNARSIGPFSIPDSSPGYEPSPAADDMRVLIFSFA